METTINSSLKRVNKKCLFFNVNTKNPDIKGNKNNFITIRTISLN